MSETTISRTLPALLHRERHARNGQVPVATALQRIAMALNTFAGRNKKLIFMRGQELDGVLGGDLADTDIWPIFFRSGENTIALNILIGLANTDVSGATNPLVTLECRRHSDGVLAGSVEVASNGRASGTAVAPNDIDDKLVKILGLEADTEYYVTTKAEDGARVVNLTVTESLDGWGDGADLAIVNSDVFIAEGPIHDRHIQDLIDAANALQKHNLAHLLSWSCDYETANGPLVSDVAYANMLSGSPAFYLDARYHGTLTREDTIPIRFAVHAVRTTGVGSLSVRLRQPDRAVNAAEITGITTGGVGNWYVTDGVLPGTRERWQLEAYVTGGGSFRLGGVSAFIWEA